MPNDRLETTATRVRGKPVSLEEQLALSNAKNGGGKAIMQGKINDPRYQGDWIKMDATIKTSDGNSINIHYWYNTVTREITGIKFTIPSYYSKFPSTYYWNIKN